MLFNKSKQEVEQTYAHLITNKWERTHTIIMEDVGPELGSYTKSDIILTYSPDNQLVIAVERVYKSNYNILEWTRMGLLSQSKNAIKEDARGIKSSITYYSDKIDLVRFRKDWIEWAEDLLMS